MAHTLAVKTMHDDESGRSLAQRTEEVFRELLEALPDGCASIRRTTETHAVVLEVAPSEPSAAPISAIVPADEGRGITLIAGKGSYFEIPKDGHRYTDQPLFGELKAICSAVINGRLEEWVALDEGDIVRAKGTIGLDRAVTVRWRELSLRAFRHKLKTHYRYKPWAPSWHTGRSSAQGSETP